VAAISVVFDAGFDRVCLNQVGAASVGSSSAATGCWRPARQLSEPLSRPDRPDGAPECLEVAVHADEPRAHGVDRDVAGPGGPPFLDVADQLVEALGSHDTRPPCRARKGHARRRARIARRAPSPRRAARGGTWGTSRRPGAPPDGRRGPTGRRTTRMGRCTGSGARPAPVTVSWAPWNVTLCLLHSARSSSTCSSMRARGWRTPCRGPRTRRRSTEADAQAEVPAGEEVDFGRLLGD